jgi:hypothetical protein
LTRSEDAAKAASALTTGAAKRFKGAVERGASAYRAAKERAASLRKTYNQVANELGAVAQRLHAGGMSAEGVVRTMSPIRNELKLNIRAQGSKLLGKLADIRNQLKYGDRGGPTAEWLYKHNDDNWEKAMDSISRTNKGLNRLLGAKK